MKKLVLAFISLVALSSSVFAQNTCSGWNAYAGGAWNPVTNSYTSIPPKPYCWTASVVASYNGNNGWTQENTIGKSRTTNDHNAYWVQENGSVGIIVAADVYGLPQNKPEIRLNYMHGQLVGQTDIHSSNGTYNGTRYYFYIPHKYNSELKYWSDLELSGKLEVKDYYTTKDTLYIK